MKEVLCVGVWSDLQPILSVVCMFVSAWMSAAGREEMWSCVLSSLLSSAE